MSRFRQFEDIPVWQAGRELVKEIYRVTRYAELARDTGLVDQIRRASSSITTNIAEGHERGTTRDRVPRGLRAPHCTDRTSRLTPSRRRL